MKRSILTFAIGFFVTIAAVQSHAEAVSATEQNPYFAEVENESYVFEPEIYHFSIYKRIYPLATFFSIQSDDTYRGIVKKSVFRLRTHYDLSNEHGWQATGIKRVLSLGSFFPWATEVDIYNTDWDFIGMIDGQVVSTAAARFSIYNEQFELAAVAYLDRTLGGFSIVYPDSEAFPLAEMNRIYAPDGVDGWTVTVYDPDAIDERIIRIFAAMVCDLQESIDDYYDQDLVDDEDYWDTYDPYDDDDDDDYWHL